MKNHEIRIKLDKEELETIKQKASKAGMTISGLIRFLALNSTVSVSLAE